MKNLIRTGIVTVLGFAPFAAFATIGDSNGANVPSALTTIGNLIAQATPIVVGLALLGFFWGLAVYIFSAGDEKKRANGRNIMIWGILALFIMLSVFGIIGALQSTFGITGSQQVSGTDIPSVNTNSSGGYNIYGSGAYGHTCPNGQHDVNGVCQ